ncbi:hypothetical protein QBC32DRAFT_366349, partial [Pseudoneurospora amorphoporcata]
MANPPPPRPPPLGSAPIGSAQAPNGWLPKFMTMKTTQSVKFDIGQIQQLQGHQNWEEWKSEVAMTMDYYGLLDFLRIDLKIHVSATDEAKETFRQGRLQAYAILRNHIKPVIPKLQACGHTFDEFSDRDPHALWQALKQIIPAVSEFSKGDMVREFHSMDQEHYDDLQAYFTRYNWLWATIKSMGITMDEYTRSTILLKGLESYDRHWVENQRDLMDSGLLDHQGILNKVMKLADRQQLNAHLAVNKKSSTSSTTSTQSSPSSTTGIKCSDPRCGRMHNGKVTNPYHEACGRHHPGGDATCYKLHPELNPHAKIPRTDSSSVNPQANRTALSFDSAPIGGAANLAYDDDVFFSLMAVVDCDTCEDNSTDEMGFALMASPGDNRDQ